MERGSFFGIDDGVVDFDGDDLTPVGFDCGSKKLAINEQHVFLGAV